MRLFPRALLWAIIPALLLSACPVRGQSTSHEFDPNEAPPKDIAKLLELRRPNPLAGFDKDLLKRLVEEVGRDPKLLNELNLKDLQELQKKFPDLNDPQKLAQLQEFAKQQMQQAPPKFDAPPFDWKKFQEALKKIETVQKNQNNPVNSKNTKTDPEMIAKKDFDQSKSQPPKQSKQEEDLAKWLAKNLGESKVMKDMTKDLAKMLGKKDSDKNMFSDLENELKSLIGEQKGDPKKKDTPSLEKLASGFKLPDLKGSAGSPSTGGSSPGNVPNSTGSHFSGPSLGNLGGGTWSTVVLLFLLAGAVLIFWVLYIRPRRQRDVAADHPKQACLLPPEQVRTREDVVKAFEFLSVTKCGEQAINWHHIQIAKEISGAERDRREAANRLAYLYEKARYTPKNEVFSDIEIAEARARLQQLSGVSPE